MNPINPLENLAKMDYPGRVVLMGVNPEGLIFVGYVITGRSPSSQARKLVLSEINTEEPSIQVVPTAENLLRRNETSLLIYPAINIRGGIVVGNGQQTSSIPTNGLDDAVASLNFGLKNWTYEPDAPNFTPRITGCFAVRIPNRYTTNRVSYYLALSILKQGKGGSKELQIFEVPLLNGSGKLISTYTGENIDPLPSFRGEPLNFEVPWDNVEKAVNAVYEALAPKPRQQDFRVAVAGIYAKEHDFHSFHHFIRNRHDRG